LYAVERKIFGRRLEFELGELEGEIVVVSPLKRRIAVIGVEELLVPPAGIRGNRIGRTGVLLVYSEREGRAKLLNRNFSLSPSLNRINVRGE
jgi:hypothetical protein